MKKTFQEHRLLPYLFEPVKEDDINAINSLLNQGIDINTTDIHGQTAIHIAVYHDKVNALKYFLNRRANINIQDIKGQTKKLTTASQLQNKRKLLPESNDTYTTDEINILHQAVQNNNNAITMLLHEAVQDNNEYLVEFYINLGANFNKRINNKTPLEIAVAQENINIVKLLLKQKKLTISRPLRRWTNLLPRNEKCKEIIQLLKERIEEIKANTKAFQMVYQVEGINQEVFSLPVPTFSSNKSPSCMID